MKPQDVVRTFLQVIPAERRDRTEAAANLIAKAAEGEPICGGPPIVVRTVAEALEAIGVKFVEGGR